MKPFLNSVFALGLLISSASSANVSDDLPDVRTIAGDAPIALLIDAGTGQVLYSDNADRRFIPASITKIMSAYVAFDLIAKKQLSPDQRFVMSASAAEDWHRTGSTMFLEAGEVVSVDTLLRGITSVSANDASIVLAEGAAGSVENWVALMNDAARDLGMKDSHFGTPNGWPDDGATFTTANDLAILSKALINRHPAQYSRYFGKEGMRHNGFAQANHDPLIGVVEGADGIKTGFTGQAGYGFVGSVKRGDTRLLMVVAAVGEKLDRDTLSRDLVAWGFDGFDRKAIFRKDAEIGSVRVQDGSRESVALRAASDVSVALPKNMMAAPGFAIAYEGPVKAPIKAGEPVANLEMILDGKIAARIPLVAADDVNQAGFLKRIGNAVQSWFG